MNVVENFRSVIKLNLSFEPIDGIHAAELDFKCIVYVYSNRRVEIEKRDLIKVDDDNYIMVVDTSLIGAGEIKCRIEAKVPDVEIPIGYRLEVVTIDTGITTKE